MTTIADIKRRNKAAGLHWFEPNTLAFFNSVVYPGVTADRYFITAETNPSDETRYTVREALDDGSIDTVGEFHVHESYAAAQTWLDGFLAVREA